ncbi:hypothetical protein E4U54_002828 [Claviceps lovelessii]|nr:hypothetical protein E4U54_002828 [Claviceps lovelessii]
MFHPPGPKSHSTKLVMPILDLQVQQLFVIVPLTPRPLEYPHLVLLQPPPGRLLQRAPTNFRQGFFLARGPEPGLEARLHAYPHRGVRRGAVVLVAAQLGRCGRLGRLVGLDGDVCLARGPQLEGAGGVGVGVGAGRGDDVEALERGDGFRGGGQGADSVASEEPV